MKKSFVLHTDGKGLWSEHKAEVECTKLEVESHYNDFGELCVYFNTSTWDSDKDGLIYTDNLFLKELRSYLQTIGFSVAAAKDVSYSEQGMQGDDYVSLDVGKPFLDEWKKIIITKKVIRKK